MRACPTLPTLEVEALESGEYEARQVAAAMLPWGVTVTDRYGNCANRHRTLVEFIRAENDAD